MYLTGTPSAHYFDRWKFQDCGSNFYAPSDRLVKLKYFLRTKLFSKQLFLTILLKALFPTADWIQFSIQQYNLVVIYRKDRQYVLQRKIHVIRTSKYVRNFKTEGFLRGNRTYRINEFLWRFWPYWNSAEAGCNVACGSASLKQAR